MADYAKVPANATIKPKPFKAHIDDEKLQNMKQLLKAAPIAPVVWENSNAPHRQYGMQRDWLINAKKVWETEYDWRKAEDRINSFPNFTAQVPDDEGNELSIQFLALFSEKKDAIPIAFYHGWPGSILEFLQILDLLKSKYPPSELPYHVIVPSLVGYAFSTGPPLDRNFRIEETARVLDRLMVGLGFGDGYIAQGGDLGSSISRWQAGNCESCKAAHLNFLMGTTADTTDLPIHDEEKSAMERGKGWRESGMAYAMEHGTRTATIGFALASSPLALLSWIGEKFLEWTDEDPRLDEILTSVSLYWLTDTFPRCIYPYRALAEKSREYPYIAKPFGFSFFPKELLPGPKSWVETTGDLIAHYRHTSGGHFAALEKPKELLEDVEDFVKKAWK